MDVNSIISLLTNPWVSLGALLALPSLLQQCAQCVFQVIDRSALHSSALHQEPTGTWLQDQATRYTQLGSFKVQKQTAMIQAVDGYWPSIQTAVLRTNTYLGLKDRDRQVAAHELGHALLHSRAPKLGACLQAARTLRDPAGLLVLAYVAVSLLWVSPHPVTFALSFALLLSTHLLVLLDEGVASLMAHRHLSAHTPIAPNRLHFAAAWFVYFFPLVGFLMQCVFLIDVIERCAESIPPSEQLLLYQPIPMLVVLSAMLLKRSFSVLKGMLSPHTPQTLAEHEVFFKRALTGDIFGGLGAMLFCLLGFWGDGLNAPVFACWLAMIPGGIPAQKMGHGLIQWLLATAMRPFFAAETPNNDRPTERENPLESIRLLSANAAHRRKLLWIHILFLPLLVVWWFKYLPTPGL